MKGLEFKSFEILETKADDSGNLTINGYGAIFNNIDSGGDVIQKGSFIDTLNERKERIAFCYQHDIWNPIGKIKEIREDEKGLYLSVMISAAEDDIQTKIKEGILKEMSIGYRVVDCKDEIRNGETCRVLTKLSLYEVSLVLIAMKPLHMIEGMKSGVGEISSSFISMGEVFGVVMGDIINGLSQGGKSFAEYALSAVAAIGKVIQAKMMELAINIVSGEAAKTGLVGALVGLAASTAVLAVISGIMSKQQAPHLAEGGVSYGPTMALIGDNRSGKELVMPFEKSGEFADAISRRMGGASGGAVYGVIRGDDIHLVTSKAQGRAVRRGSGQTITF